MGVKGLNKLLSKIEGEGASSSAGEQHNKRGINTLWTVFDNTEGGQMCLAVDASGYIISLIKQMMGKVLELRLDIPSDYQKIEEKTSDDLQDIEDSFSSMLLLRES